MAKRRIANLIVEKLFGTLIGKKISILGFSYANTNDTRDSSAIDLCLHLMEEGLFYLFMIQRYIKQIETDFIRCQKDYYKENLKKRSIGIFQIMLLNL